MDLLAHVPAVRLILEQVQDRLSAQGQPHVTLQLPGQATVHTFDLMTGIHVIDHGHRQAHLKCALCPPGAGLRLRYEFRITTLSGDVIQPVGSSCIFLRALGYDEAKRIGANLAEQVRVHQARLKVQTQLELLTAAGNWREYLRRQGFDWVLTAMAGSHGLSKVLRDQLTILHQQNKPLPESLLRQLRASTHERKPVAVPLPHPITPAVAPAAFQAQSAPLATPKSSRGRAPVGAGTRLSPDRWQAYLIANRINVIVRRWSEVTPLLDLEDDTRNLVQEAIQAHQPFRLEVLTLLQRLIKDDKIQAYLRRDNPAATSGHGRAAFKTNVGTPESEKLISVKREQALRDARYWNPGLKVLLPPAVWARLQTAFQDGLMRQDDYRFLVSVLVLQENPVAPRHRNTTEFLKWLALRLAQDGHIAQAEACLNANRKHQILKRVGAQVQQYQQGQRVQERLLLACAVSGPGSAPAAALVAGSTSNPLRTMSQVAPPPPTASTPRLQNERAVPRKGPLSPKTSIPTGRPSQWPIESALPYIQKAWKQGLSHMMPSSQRMAIGRAVQQGVLRLAPEQSKLLQTALHVYYDTLPQGTVSQSLPGQDTRTPIRYAATLGHLFGELDLPFLQQALAKQRMNWAATSFPDAYARYQDTGSATHRLVDIWLALM